MTSDTAQHSHNRLELLYRLSQAFNSSLDLSEVLNRVIDEVIAVLHAERGFIMLVEPDGTQTFRAARGLDQRTIDHPQSQVSQSVLRKVMQEGQSILTNDAQSDTRFNTRQSVMMLGLRSILCVPVKIKERVVGVVYADNRFETGIFTPADLDLLAAITSLAAISIENARLYQMAVEKGRLQQELEMAREMQVSFLPETVPEVQGWEFAAHWQPAREVAGDYYDFIPAGAENLGLVIADVTDKGAAAALFMVFSNSIVRASVYPNLSPAESMANANRLISEKSPDSMFVSLVYLLLNPRTGQAVYVNAGHNPPLFYQRSTGSLHPLSRTGMVMGVDADTPYEQRELHLSEGDFLLLFTDGLTDAINRRGEAFGLSRVEAVLREQAHAAADDLIAYLLDALFQHTGPTQPLDDITIVLVKRSAAQG